MAKRAATENEIKAAPTLPIDLPPSTHASNPISRGAKPELYRVADLKKAATRKQARTDEFEKRLIGIWWLGALEAVPFIFRTNDGTLRSLDAGCVGFLMNRAEPECELITNEAGYVVGIVPGNAMIKRYGQIRAKLTDAVACKA